MNGLLVPALAAFATWRLLVRRPWPRRDPAVHAGSVLPADPGGPTRVPHAPDGPPDRALSSGSLGRRSRADDRAGGRGWLPVSRRSGSRTASPPADLTESVDLLAVATVAGSTIPVAVAAVGDSGTGPTAAALRAVTVATQRGTGLVDALEELDRLLGPVGRELRIPLASGVTSGTPVGPALRRLADQLRLRHRREVERRVRRLPVLMLLPLCGFVLPAFVVLTLVPVALATARDLDLLGVDATGPTPPGPAVTWVGPGLATEPSRVPVDVPP